MFNIRSISSVLVCLLCSFSSLTLAGTFTPAAGAIIISNNVTVRWTSTASEQWVRAYNSNAENIFDSGRQRSHSGQVDFTVDSSATLLRVVFYEKTNNWIANERSYQVAIGHTAGGDTLSDLNCTTGQIAQYNYGTWICATIATGTPGPQGEPGPQGPAGADGMDAQIPTYSLAGTGPAGGFVFYVTDDGLHGYEAAPADLGRASWCNNDEALLTAKAVRLGSGLHNTDHIIAACGTESAAGITDAYSYQGYVDWFLPSKDALMMMYENLHLLGQGGFSFPDYWSSSESSANHSFAQDFTDGRQYLSSRTVTRVVRPVRAF